MKLINKQVHIMSSEPIDITQDAIYNLKNSGVTEITPKEIVGKGYNKNNFYNYIIAEDITIPMGITLQDFNNIAILGGGINNEGTIKNCEIILSKNSYIHNGVKSEGNINDCIIYLFSSSYIENGYTNIGNITDCSIALYNISYIRNGVNSEGNIIGCNITLNNCLCIENGYSEVGNINGCIITLIGASAIYNSYNSEGKISNSFIFIHDGAILQNFYYDYYTNTTKYGILTDNYIFVSNSCIIQNSCDYNSGSGIFNSTILKFSDDCTIDNEIEKEKIIDKKNIVIMNTTEIEELKKLKEDNKNLSNIVTRLNKENEILNNQISGNTTVKNNTLNKLLLLSYLTQKDNGILNGMMK